ncbi:MAG: NAD(P)-dependent oxidoreductase [Phycisphaerales bacterium]|nr:MAG: NAD(P)-dependent oxidoreductase [Phycisphaerales bacterium]
MLDAIGLVGIGLVGTAIAESLLAAKFGVVGFDIDSDGCKRLDEMGGKALGSAADVAEETDRIVLSLPSTDIVQQVVEGPGGILEADSPPRYIIDTTTGDPEETTELAEILLGRGIYLLDSTISGSSKQVRDRQAVLMIGGDKQAFDACEDVFHALSEKVFYLGPSGFGSKAKLASNLVLGLNRLVLAEGLVFAARLGLDPRAFLELLRVTPAYSAAMDSKGQKMIDADFTAEARIRQHHKDVSLILKYAESLGQELPLSEVHRDVLDRAIAAGDGDLDNSAVIREIQRRARQEGGPRESE